METKLDRFGRIVIPKKIREHFNLKAGSPIRIEEVDQAIVLKPVQGEPNLVLKNGVLVFSGTPIGNLEQALDEDRKDRIKSSYDFMKRGSAA